MAIKKLISIALIFNLIFVLFAVSYSYNSLADTVTTAYIEGSNVNVRSGPSTSHSIIDSISNTTATVLDKSGSGDNLWYKITYQKGSSAIVGYIKYDSSYIRIVTYDPDASFETKISAFPDSYKPALRALHATYPNWEFIPDPVSVSFSSAVTAQTKGFRKLVQSSQSIAWRSMGNDDYYNWKTKTWGTTEGGWYAASYEVIAYYMDPRNFLDNDYIYMFLDQSYNPTYQNEEGLLTIIDGTFLEKGYTDSADTAYDGSYVKVIMEAARQSGVSPYIIAAKIIQEIGSAGTSSMISGTTSHGKYFNFFNWGATGSTTAQIIANGLATAKTNGWNTRSKAIIGGAKKLSDGYISAGQNTYYYQNFNVKNNATHQYAQAIHDSASKASLSGDDYKTKYNAALTFSIPVFTNMPTSACARPAQNSKLNNYYIIDIAPAYGNVSPTFSKYTNSYSYENTGKRTAITFDVEIPQNATFTSAKSFAISSGTKSITLTVKSQTGYTRNYTLSFKTSVNCDLTLNVYNTGNKPTTPDPAPDPTPPSTYKLGDVNNDGKISISDLGAIKLNLLGEYTFSNTEKLAADINKDGKISISDLGAIKLHLLGDYNIEG